MPTPTTAVVLSFRDAALRRPIDLRARGSRRFAPSDRAPATGNVIPLADFAGASRRSMTHHIDVDPLPGGEAA